MNGLEYVESLELAADDPIDAIIALAQDCGASAIAEDARRVVERLENARLYVSVVGSPRVVASLLGHVTGRPVSPCVFEERALAVRSRRGVVYDFRALGARWRSPRRVDMVLVDEREAATPAFDSWRSARMLVRDTACSDERAKAFAAIHQLAVETGAARVEAQIARHALDLCARLQHHLYEHHRALGRADLSTRINALAIARALAERMLDARARQPDSARARLADQLAVERTKFLVAKKVDALVAFDEQLARQGRRRHALRREADAVAGEIVADLLASLWERMRAAIEAPLAAHSKRLVADLAATLGDLGESIPLDAVAGLDLVTIRGFRRDAERSPSSSVIAQLADRMRLASRKRIERVARGDIVARLETGSRRLVATLLDDYDEMGSAIDHRFCELLDSAIESARLADEFARHAHADGVDAVARARSRVSHWRATLATIITRLD